MKSDETEKEYALTPKEVYTMITGATGGLGEAFVRIAAKNGENRGSAFENSPPYQRRGGGYSKALFRLYAGKDLFSMSGEFRGGRGALSFCARGTGKRAGNYQYFQRFGALSHALFCRLQRDERGAHFLFRLSSGGDEGERSKSNGGIARCDAYPRGCPRANRRTGGMGKTCSQKSRFCCGM